MMSTQAFDAVTRRSTAGISRRSSLLALGGAALAATIANPERSSAKQKKGNDCKKKEKQRCSNDAAACKTTVPQVCDPAGPASCLELHACCDSCSASGFLICLLTAVV